MNPLKAITGGMGLLVLSITSHLNAAALDIDDNGLSEAVTDGLLVLRYQFGFRGTALVDGAIGSNPNRTTQEIEFQISSLEQRLDIDADGMNHALSDGLLVLRYLMGFRGERLITGAIGPGAVRGDHVSVQQHVAKLLMESLMWGRANWGQVVWK